MKSKFDKLKIICNIQTMFPNHSTICLEMKNLKNITNELHKYKALKTHFCKFLGQKIIKEIRKDLEL